MVVLRFGLGTWPPANGAVWELVEPLGHRALSCGAATGMHRPTSQRVTYLTLLGILKWPLSKETIP